MDRDLFVAPRWRCTTQRQLFPKGLFHPKRQAPNDVFHPFAGDMSIHRFVFEVKTALSAILFPAIRDHSLKGRACAMHGHGRPGLRQTGRPYLSRGAIPPPDNRKFWRLYRDFRTPRRAVQRQGIKQPGPTS